MKNHVVFSCYFCAKKHHDCVFTTEGIHFADLFLPHHQKKSVYGNN